METVCRAAGCVSVCLSVDIDECDDDDACMYGTCANVPGGYECRCDDQHQQLIPSGTGCVGTYMYICSLPISQDWSK